VGLKLERQTRLPVMLERENSTLRLPVADERLCADANES
jgi:hypothetical protein